MCLEAVRVIRVVPFAVPLEWACITLTVVHCPSIMNYTKKHQFHKTLIVKALRM